MSSMKTINQRRMAQILSENFQGLSTLKSRDRLLHRSWERSLIAAPVLRSRYAPSQ